MCGIAGFVRFTPEGRETMEGHVRAMTRAIVHRGPDDEGIWLDPEFGVALGFRRLAIIDLTQAGHQPMESPSGRFVIVFNGEVYNHRELRAELGATGVRFRGHSDTEVIAAAFDRWGIDRSVSRFIGMFAIAAWDREAHSLRLIRDRLGIKPLYVVRGDGFVGFASELKSLVAGPTFDRRIDPRALASYLKYLYVPAPLSIFSRVSKLLPGHTAEISARAISEPEPYWSAAAAQREGAAAPFTGDEQEAAEELDRLLRNAVKLRLEADVPLGALLSGGVDSSVVVALMRAVGSGTPRTYSIGFPQSEHDESVFAARVADHLGTHHSPLDVTAADALALVPDLPKMLDEPFSDPSIIPTFIVSKLARRDVTVALTGDGGDELFGGYNRYVRGAPMIQRAQRVPTPLRRATAAALRGFSSQSWDRTYRALSAPFPRRMRHRLAGEKLAKLGDMLALESESEMYLALLSIWHEPSTFMIEPSIEPGPVESQLAAARRLPLLERMMLTDQATYLADDLLAKVDRASMAVSLEARVPILDHRVVEFSWTLPKHLLIRDGRGKWLLRQVLSRYLPAEFIDRPKVGFTVPLADWLRGPLRAWAMDTFMSGDLEQGGLLRGEPVRDAWRQFEAGHHEHALGLWTLLMFEEWRRHWQTQ